MARVRIGLDVGSTAVRAAELKVGSEVPTLVRAAQVPIPAGAVENGEVHSVEAVADALRELWRRGRFRTKQVTMGVGSQRVVVREVTVPAIPDKELRQSLPFQVQDLIPIPMEEAVLDYDVLDEFEDEGRRMLRLLVVAAQRDLVGNLVEAATEARLRPIGVDLVPFALVRSIATEEGLGLEAGDSGGEAVVDVGADVTAICVHERAVPRFVRILPSGGADVLRQVGTALGISFEQAEALAKGELMPQDPAAAQENLRAQVTSLVDEIRSSLDFYQSQTPGAQVRRVLVTGGGSKLPGVFETLGGRLATDVHRGHAFGKVGVRLDMDEATLANAEPLLAVAVGLALPPPEGGR